MPIRRYQEDPRNADERNADDDVLQRLEQGEFLTHTVGVHHFDVFIRKRQSRLAMPIAEPVFDRFVSISECLEKS
jgi:hypothetical protein